MLEGWRGAVVASLVTALILFAINEPPNHEAGIQAQNEASGALAFLFSPEMLLVYFTAALFAVGVLTYATFKRQADTMSEQIKLGRDEFNATHRPKLDVRLIRLNQFTPGKPVILEWCVSNIGDAEGTIFDSNASIMFALEPLPPVPRYTNRRDSMGSLIIPPGASPTIAASLTLPESDWLTYKISQNDRTRQSLYFFGYILYRAGETQTRRSMAFCRRYDPSSERFLVVNDPNYEHTA